LSLEISERTKRIIPALGAKWTKDAKLKQSKRLKGRCLNTGKTHFRKGVRPWNSGLSNWADSKHAEKLRQSAVGRIPWNKGLWGYNSGSLNGNWKGGVHTVNNALRRTQRYKNWRTSVFKRDNYTCQFCKASGVYIEADHIKPFAFYPDLRFEITNGRTLCKECHMKTPTYKKHKLVEVTS